MVPNLDLGEQLKRVTKDYFVWDDACFFCHVPLGRLPEVQPDGRTFYIKQSKKISDRMTLHCGYGSHFYRSHDLEALEMCLNCAEIIDKDKLDKAINDLFTEDNIRGHLLGSFCCDWCKEYRNAAKPWSFECKDSPEAIERWKTKIAENCTCKVWPVYEEFTDDIISALYKVYWDSLEAKNRITIISNFEFFSEEDPGFMHPITDPLPIHCVVIKYRKHIMRCHLCDFSGSYSLDDWVRPEDIKMSFLNYLQDIVRDHLNTNHGYNIERPISKSAYFYTRKNNQ